MERPVSLVLLADFAEQEGNLIDQAFSKPPGIETDNRADEHHPVTDEGRGRRPRKDKKTHVS
jgi:hypothetical protein